MLLALVAAAWAGPASARFKDGYTLVWSGVDYRAVEIYVPESFGDPTEQVYWGPGGGLFDFVGTFASPEDAWVYLCKSWNEMMVAERVPQMRKQLGASVVVDVPDVCGASYGDGPRFRAEAEAARRPPRMNDADVAAAVQSWPATKTEGLGLLVVAERFAKSERRACVWPTFYDLQSRVVLHTDRVCADPGGLGFRNYWYGPVATATKDAVTALAAGKL